MTSLSEIVEREQKFILQTYNRYPLALERGKGVFLFDLDGKKYLDFVAGIGVNALGHAHPRVVRTIREQAARLVHISNLYYHEYQGRLAEKLTSLSGMNRVFFSNSGTEAIDGSYHGRTFGALSLTGQGKHRRGFEPLLEDVTFVARNNLEALRAAVTDDT